jgi:glycerol uptake facilitator-like aquaporin
MIVFIGIIVVGVGWFLWDLTKTANAQARDAGGTDA